jgi:predicted nicotinamide N-methyase
VTTSNSLFSKSQLQNYIAELIPGARLEVNSLPQCQQLRLLLLNEDYPRHSLDRETSQRLMDEPAYWAFCWASGQVLARYLLDMPQLVQGKCVLDFGCGSGVAGIAAALAGASRVIACDLDPLALSVSRLNAEISGVELDLLDDFFSLTEAVDLIVVADVLYDRSNLPLLEALAQYAPVLLADSRIKDFSEPGFQYLASIESHTVPNLDESREFNQVKLYTSHIVVLADGQV